MLKIPAFGNTRTVVTHLNLNKSLTISTKIISGIAILLSGFFASLGLFEYYNISIKKNTEFYPFGGEGPVPYYYKSAELYSMVNLSYGILFAVLFILILVNLKIQKINVKVLFGLICVLIIIQISQSNF